MKKNILILLIAITSINASTVNSVIENLYQQVSSKKILSNKEEIIKKIKEKGMKQKNNIELNIKKNKVLYHPGNTKKTPFHKVNKSTILNIEEKCKKTTKNKFEYQVCINRNFRKTIENEKNKKIKTKNQDHNHKITHKITSLNNKNTKKNKNINNYQKQGKLKIITISNPYATQYIKNKINYEFKLRKNYLQK